MITLTSPPIVSSEAPPVSILLVENDHAFAELLAAKLKASLDVHYRLTHIPTLTAAFEFLDTQPCHLVIADLDLPESSGLLSFKALLEHSNSALPIIALVANQDDETVSNLFASGAIDVREKGAATGVSLARVIRATLESHRLHKELEQARRDLKNLTHAVAHDLKAPLSRIVRFLDLLVQEMTPEAFTEEASKQLDLIRSSAENSTRIVEDLLTFSQLGAHLMKPRPVELNELAEKAVAELRSEIAANRAQITIGPLPRIEADPDLITHALRNLMSNSLQYRREDPPRIEIRAEDSPTMIVISVADNGVGIDPAHFRRVFKPFKRIGNAPGADGSGLGLPVCKRIIEGHRGRIWIESGKDAGTVVNISLPKKQRSTLPGAVTLETQSPAL